MPPTMYPIVVEALVCHSMRLKCLEFPKFVSISVKIFWGRNPGPTFNTTLIEIKHNTVVKITALDYKAPSTIPYLSLIRRAATFFYSLFWKKKFRGRATPLRYRLKCENFSGNLLSSTSHAKYRVFELRG